MNSLYIFDKFISISYKMFCTGIVQISLANKKYIKTLIFQNFRETEIKVCCRVSLQLTLSTPFYANIRKAVVSDILRKYRKRPVEWNSLSALWYNKVILFELSYFQKTLSQVMKKKTTSLLFLAKTILYTTLVCFTNINSVNYQM